jgi:hypothetical protein
MIKPYLSWLTISCCLISSCGNAQNQNNNKFLVFKVEHQNDRFVGYKSTAYSFIEKDKLKDFSIARDSLIDDLKITYYITRNGGMYVSESFSDFYTLGCCEYESIEKVVLQDIKGQVTNDEIQRYANAKLISVSDFESEPGKRFFFRKGTEKYNITVWVADLEYCVCSLYMETPGQPIYGNQGAYLKSIKSVRKPTIELTDSIKPILQSLVTLDMKVK